MKLIDSLVRWCATGSGQWCKAVPLAVVNGVPDCGHDTPSCVRWCAVNGVRCGGAMVSDVMRWCRTGYTVP